MKIGILTHPLTVNYGCLMQAYALQKLLLDMGHDVYTIDLQYRYKYKSIFHQFLGWMNRIRLYYMGNKQIPIAFHPSLTKKQEDIVAQNTRPFTQKNIRTTRRIFHNDELPALDKEYLFDAYVVGSDQVWLPYMAPWMFLSFIQRDNVKRFAYAASFGKDIWEFTPEQTMECSKFAKLFDAISVREDSGVNLCKDNLDVDAVHVLDPTLLLSKDKYMSLVRVETSGKRTLFSYVLDKSLGKSEIIEYIAYSNELEICTCMAEESIVPGVTKDYSKCIFPPVDKWLNGFNNSEFVVTDSFHGTVFAIIFNKQFITIGNERRGMARFHSLLKLFGLESRLVHSFEDAKQILDQQIDYERVNLILERKRLESLEFLYNIK